MHDSMINCLTQSPAKTTQHHYLHQTFDDKLQYQTILKLENELEKQKESAEESLMWKSKA